MFSSKSKVISIFLSICLVISLVLPASVQASNFNVGPFLKKYTDEHFNLSKEPNRSVTVEEFVAIVTAYSYWATGSSNAPVVDKKGKYPSNWCAKYVQAEVEKGTLDVSKYAYQEPATVAFAAEYLSRAKGLYHWDHENMYTFTNTSSLDSEQKMYLNVAADYKLIPYTYGMSATAPILRSQILDNYLVPAGKLPTVTAPAEISNGSMKELHAYLVTDVSAYESQTIPAQNEQLLKYKDDVTMVTIQGAFISNHPANDGYRYIHSNMKKAGITDTIAICNEENILSFLGISNYGVGGFDSPTIEKILSDVSTMESVVYEIVDMVEEYNLDGVNIGFEHVKDSYRYEYNIFLAKLASQLHQRDKLLMTTAGAYISDVAAENSFYDYETINKSSDYVHIILYDDYSMSAYNNNTVDTGELSNMVRIDRALKYITQVIPSNKILLGMGSYGIDYNTSTHKAVNVPRPELLQLASSHGTTITQTPIALGGTYNYSDSTGNHTVYLETDSGVRSRLLRTYRYNLLGASFFYLGSEHPALINTATELSTYKPEIQTAIKNDLVPVEYRGNYRAPINRVEFCDLIVAFIESKSGQSIDTFLQEKGVSIQKGQFKDTHSQNVLKVAALGIVAGRGNGEFGTGTITRQEAATMLMRLAKTMNYSGTGTAITFNDTTSLASWAKEGITFTSAIKDPTNGYAVMSGTGKNNFSPYGLYTREQSMMTMIRLFHAIG